LLFLVVLECAFCGQKKKKRGERQKDLRKGDPQVFGAPTISPRNLKKKKKSGRSGPPEGCAPRGPVLTLLERGKKKEKKRGERKRGKQVSSLNIKKKERRKGEKEKENGWKLATRQSM